MCIKNDLMWHDDKSNYSKKNKPPISVNHSLDASKPPEGAGVLVAGSGAAGTIGTAATEAGTGAVGDGRDPRVSKPVSRRSFCTGARAGAGVRAVGARVGDIRPKEVGVGGWKWGADSTVTINMNRTFFLDVLNMRNTH